MIIQCGYTLFSTVGSGSGSERVATEMMRILPYHTQQYIHILYSVLLVASCSTGSRVHVLKIKNEKVEKGER